MSFVQGAITAAVVFVVLGAVGLFRKKEVTNEEPKKETVRVFSQKSNKSLKSLKSVKSSTKSKKPTSTKSLKSSTKSNKE